MKHFTPICTVTNPKTGKSATGGIDRYSEKELNNIGLFGAIVASILGFVGAKALAKYGSDCREAGARAYFHDSERALRDAELINPKGDCEPRAQVGVDPNKT